MTTHRLTRIALFSALSVALRYAFGALPNIQPITAIFLVTATSLGLVDSLLIMSLTMLITSFLFGFGIWVFWQLAAYTIVLIFWKMLCYPLTSLLKSATIKLLVSALLAGLMGILYGLVIDSLSALFYQMPIWAYVLNGMVFNLAHAGSTALFYPPIHTIFARFEPKKE